MKNKHPKADLKAYHTIFFQIGLIGSLLLLLSITNIEIPTNNQINIHQIDFEPDIEIVTPPNTKKELPPPPSKPVIPEEVPDHTLIDEDIDIPVLDIDRFVLELPEKPPKEEDEEIVDFIGIEILPVMKGGLEALYTRIKYPEMARKAGIEGVVSVQFVVDKNGEVINPKIVRSIGGGCDEEVLRVIKEMKFTPGVQNGNIVAVRMIQSVLFRLQK